MNLRYLFLGVLAFSLQSCCIIQKCEDPKPTNDLPSFSNQPIISKVNVNHLDEVSGIAPAYGFADSYWLIEDSGTRPKIELLKNDGTHIKQLPFAGNNRDWEDIATGPGPEADKKYIYIAETGDNNVIYTDYYIYRFPEPNSNQTSIEEFDTIHFRYPNNVSLNAETLLLDPKTKDLYVVTKDQLNVHVYKLAYPQSTQEVNRAEFMGTIGFLGIVGGDISSKGDEILLKSYASVFYWKLKPEESIFQALSRKNDLSGPYIVEPQGESICWDIEAKGYYTISEKGNLATMPPLYYYFKN